MLIDNVRSIGPKENVPPYDLSYKRIIKSHQASVKYNQKCIGSRPSDLCFQVTETQTKSLSSGVFTRHMYYRTHIYLNLGKV